MLLRYPNGDLGGHEDDVGDLIPAPGDTCPGSGDAGYAMPTPTPTAPSGGGVEATVTAEPTETPQRSDRASDTGSGGPAATATTAAAATPSPAAVVENGDRLPFTGLDLGLLFALGCGLVLTGSGLRLINRP